MATKVRSDRSGKRSQEKERAGGDWKRIEGPAGARLGAGGFTQACCTDLPVQVQPSLFFSRGQERLPPKPVRKKEFPVLKTLCLSFLQTPFLF